MLGSREKKTKNSKSFRSKTVVDFTHLTFTCLCSLIIISHPYDRV